MRTARSTSPGLALVAGVSLFAGACLVVPLPPHDPSLAAARWLAEAGVSASREDILLHLGGPDLVRENETIFVYIWHDPRLFWIIAVGAPGGGVGGGAAGGVIEKEFAVILELDPNGGLKRHAVASHLLSPRGCTPSGLCVEDSPNAPFWVLLEEERLERGDHLIYERHRGPRGPSWLAKHPDRCGLYVFPHGLSVGVVHIDSRFAGFASGAGFLRLPVPPGTHDVSVAHMAGSPLILKAETLRVACPAAGERFVVQRGAGFLDLEAGRLELVPAEQVPNRTRRFLHALRE